MIKDVFQAYLVEGAHFVGAEEFPALKSCNKIPENLIPFSKTKGVTDYKQVVHFYEPDYKLCPFANNPRIYLPRLQKFEAIIACDLSVYRDMPLVLQKYQTFRNRALSFWLQKNDVPIIPNVRYGDERTYSFCFDGIPKNSVISIGTHGSMKHRDDIHYHIKGISETIKRLKPQAVLIYGAIVDDIEYIINSNKVPLYVYESYISTVFKDREEPSYPLFDALEKGGA